MTAALAVLSLSAVPVGAQSDDPSAEPAMDMSGQTIVVGGTEYRYTNLPTSVPLGTVLTFADMGAEPHELILNRIDDSVTASLDELMSMAFEQGVDLQAEGLVSDVEGGFLFALPGMTADGSITLDQEGRYVVLCFVPSGLDMNKLAELGVDITTLGPDTDPSTMSPEAQAYLEEVNSNPPHVAQGMIQEFYVTAADSTPGPLPEADTTGSEAATE